MSSTTEQIEKRAQELLNQLTLDEKLGMMDADTPLWSGFMEMMGGAYNAHPWPAGVVERLGIPGILFTDGPRGVILEGGTTFGCVANNPCKIQVGRVERIG